MNPTQVGLLPEDRFFVCHEVVSNRSIRRREAAKNRRLAALRAVASRPSGPGSFESSIAVSRDDRRAVEADVTARNGSALPSGREDWNPLAGRRRSRARLALLLTGFLSASALTTFAFEDDAEAQRRRRLKTTDLTLKGSVAARPLVLVGALAVLSLLPFVIIMVTSFVKISVVMSIVRSAIGTQQIPPTQVITGMSIILTVYIMTPVGLDIYKATENMVQEKRPGASLVSAETVDLIFEAAVEAKGPIKGFLSKNSHLKDRAMFFSMAKRLRKPEDRSGVGPEDLMVLVPSFVISELKEAFQIGFIIFVPFLVIDMIVANILMALGMQMLSPTTISLPFKLLLFVMIDGWYLITKGLITGYV